MRFNCDMGESFGNWKMGNDEAIMPHIDMANIACGFHASDPVIMARTVALALKHDVAIGAHPGYPDLHGFGRREMQLSAEELRQGLLYQMGALQAICRAQGARISYIKPHGALYNRKAVDHAVLENVMATVAAFDPTLPLMMIAGVRQREALELARKHGIQLLFEAFCDRAYNDDGTLVPRGQPAAVHSDPQRVLQQVREISLEQRVTTISGGQRPLVADSICLHGDSAHLLDSIQAIREALRG
ncbi:MAG: 5-oxoprolinase subunit PxpA [Gammaproteobacteria bacterium]|nr:5-oxoprolinase subunit PxpA [Gammaproteobacteria bacterium]